MLEFAGGSSSTTPFDVVADIAGSIAVIVALSVFAVQLYDRRRRYADGLTAWIREEIYSEGTMHKFHAVASNAADAAVFDVVLFILPIVGRPNLLEYVIGTVPPGQEREVELGGEFAGRRDEGWGERPKKPLDFVVEVRFTDAQGHRWRRDRDGRLHHWSLVKAGRRSKR